MTRLAQFSSLSRQGELLCTQGLAYLLEDSDARSALADTIARLRKVSGPLTWRPEPIQPDGGRPDLEACTADGKPVVKVEAKLGAAFEMDQLHSYVGDLEVRSGGGLLLMLVPHYRSNDAKVVASNAFDLLDVPGHGPWQPNGWPNSGVAVITWEEILEVLQSVRSQPFANDLDQFRAMYEALTFCC